MAHRLEKIIYNNALWFNTQAGTAAEMNEELANAQTMKGEKHG